jgi:hydrogenase-4 component B
MSGVMIKTGIYGIIRMYVMLDWHTPLFGHLVLIAGIISGILGIVYALGQKDLKRLLAYSSVENIGIILIGLGVGMIGIAAGNPIMAVLGFAGGLLHVLNHSIYKSLLFMGAGMVLHKTGTRSIDQMGGLIKRMKFTGTTFLIGSLVPDPLVHGLKRARGRSRERLISAKLQQ